jgi:putative ABC transport system permease protein
MTLPGGFWQDARYALRALRRSPGFTAVAVVSLALGIGANTAIFSLVETVLLRMLPVSHPEQLVELLQKYPGEPRGNGYWTRRSYEHFRDSNHVFSALIGTSIDNQVRLTAPGAEPETTVGEYVTGNYFPELGLRPAVGRLLGPEDNPASANGAVAVVSWSYWTRRFHRDPAILGKEVIVQGTPATIIGVAPAAFVGPRVEAKTDIWLRARPDMGLNLLGRLKPGVTLEEARAEMAVLYRFTIDERSSSSDDPQIRQLTVQVEPAGNGLATVRDRFGKPLTVLMTVSGLLLLLACVNIASMLLARGAGREREMALRISLGAGRGRLLRQVLTESLILSVAGTVISATVAIFGTGALLRILASSREHQRVYLRVQPDLHVLLFAAGVTIFAGLLFGSGPALAAFRTAPVSALRQTGRGGETYAMRLFGKALVAIQVGLSVLLLSSAGLFVANLSKLEHTDLGFRADHVLLVTLNSSTSGRTGEQMSRVYQDLLTRLEAIPGVSNVSISAPTPLQGAGAAGFANVEGHQERPENRRWISISYVGPRYFETLGTPLLAGRGFAFRDQAYASVAIVNQRFARYYFAGRDPIGKHVTLEHVTGVNEPRTYEVIGVAGDANYYEIREAPHRAIYLPAFHDGVVGAQTFVIRTGIDPLGVAGDVQRALHELVPSAPVTRIVTLRDQIDASIVPERLVATLSGFFGAVGALLAGIGLYGLLAYTVARRTNEIGIRMALGASSGKVARMVLRDAFATVIVGIVFGVPMVIWARSLAAALIQDVSVQTALPLVLGATVIIAIAFLASYVPARRAARVDPMEALRQE